MIVLKLFFKKVPLKTIFTSSYSQLPDPWHANQSGNFVTNVRCVVLAVTVVPACCIDTRSKNGGHPSPESSGVSNLKICRQLSLSLQL